MSATTENSPSLSSLNITTIIPSYNIGPYLDAAIESALRQTPPFNRIIIIDDGSTDSTCNIVQRYNDQRILYYHQKNQGLGPARNKGIELAAGSEYLYFLDGDDILADGMLQHISSIITRENSPDLIAFSALDFDCDTNNILPSSDYFKRKATGSYNSGKEALLVSLKTQSFPVCAYIYVFKASLLDGKNRLRFLNVIHEDELFTPSLFMRSKKTIISNDVLYYRRVRSGSIMKSPASARNVIGLATAANWWMDNAATEIGEARHLFIRQSQYLYSQAVIYAARAHLSFSEFADLIEKNSPGFSRFINFDYVLSKFSRKLTAKFIQLRGVSLPL